MEQGPTYRVSLPKYPSKDPHYRILAHQRSRFTHDYFYIRDEVLGPMVLLVASFFPFQTAYYLNGHSFIEQELRWVGIGFRKHDNAFLAIADPAALQAAADRLSPDIIRRRSVILVHVSSSMGCVGGRPALRSRRIHAVRACVEPRGSQIGAASCSLFVIPRRTFFASERKEVGYARRARACYYCLSGASFHSCHISTPRRAPGCCRSNSTVAGTVRVARRCSTVRATSGSV